MAEIWTMLLACGWMGVLLALMALLALVLIVERLIAYSRESTRLEEFTREFTKLIHDKNIQGAKDYCVHEERQTPSGSQRRYKGHIAEVFRMALDNLDRGPATLRNILNNHIDLKILPRLRARLRALNAIARGGPMVGLLGTVSGMMGAFGSIAGTQGGGVDPKLLAGNIGLALGTTFLGLVIAIPVLFTTAYFRSVVEQFEIDLDRYSDHCLDLLFPGLPPTMAAATLGQPDETS